MSDFDREAERERLREKYEREQEKRESTERMSELLLKGATMTDAHCGNCGDPIFRYDGEEFCPTCQERVAPGEEAAGEDGTADAEGDDASGATPEGAEGAAGREGSASPTGSDGSTADAAGTDATADAGTGQPVDPPARDANGTGAATTPDATPSAPDATTTPDPAASRGDASAPTQQTQTPSPAQSRSQPESQPRSPPESAGDAGDNLAAARASLTRTLVTQARKAENCEDPRRAKDHLAAAREAAEALAALSY
jgi:hypothetical protein